MGFFPVDDETVEYFKGTGRTETEITAFQNYFKAQNLYGVPAEGDIDYTRVVSLDLASVTPSLAGPKRPQDRIELGNVKNNFTELFSKPTPENGFNKNPDDLAKVYTTTNNVSAGVFADVAAIKNKGEIVIGTLGTDGGDIGKNACAQERQSNCNGRTQKANSHLRISEEKLKNVTPPLISSAGH